MEGAVSGGVAKMLQAWENSLARAGRPSSGTPYTASSRRLVRAATCLWRAGRQAARRAARLVLIAHIVLLAASTPGLTQQPSGLPQEAAEHVSAAVSPPSVEAEHDSMSGSRAMPVGLRELSPWSMFLTATPLVQAIMVVLALASLITWTTFIGKFVELFIAKRRLTGALNAAGRAEGLMESLAALPHDRSVMRAFVATAINEARLSTGLDNEAGIKERAASSFAEITRAESRRVRFGMGALATIGATAPFVGLFGTVWGIMNSFIGISKAQTTNLAVVAPGIAEALLATAIGLFAAIPAVVIYNHFSRGTKGYLELVSRASGAAGRQLSRDLDRARSEPMRRAAE